MGEDDVGMHESDETGVSNEGIVRLMKLMVNDMKKACRGIVRKSNGARFCCRYDCNVASHKTHKVQLFDDEARYFIAGPQGGQILTEPVIPVSWVTTMQDRCTLESSFKSPAVWKLLFQKIEVDHEANADANGDLPMTKGDEPVTFVNQLEKIQAAKDGLKTPKRTRFTGLDDVCNITDAAIETHPISLVKRPKLGKLKDIVKSEDPDTTKRVLMTHIIEQWDDMISQLEETRDNIRQGHHADKLFREFFLENH